MEHLTSLHSITCRFCSTSKKWRLRSCWKVMPVFTLPSLSSTSFAGRKGNLKVLNRGSSTELLKRFPPVLATMGASSRVFNAGEADVGTLKELSVVNNQHTLGVIGIAQSTKFPPPIVISDQQPNPAACVPMTIAVAEFKGPDVHGVVRFAQGSSGERGSCSIEAVIDGLAPGAHGWSVHEYGDLTQGPMSTGPVYNIDPASSPSEKRGNNLGMLVVDSHGHVETTATHDMLIVADVIGRSVVLYGVSKEGHITRVAAAVIARSARPSSLNPQLCNCDGSLLWQGATTS